MSVTTINGTTYNVPQGDSVNIDSSGNVNIGPSDIADPTSPPSPPPAGPDATPSQNPTLSEVIDAIMNYFFPGSASDNTDASAPPASASAPPASAPPASASAPPPPAPPPASAPPASAPPASAPPASAPPASAPPASTPPASTPPAAAAPAPASTVLSPADQTSFQDNWNNQNPGKSLTVASDTDNPQFSDFKGNSYEESQGVVVIGNKAYFDSSTDTTEHQNYLKASQMAQQWDQANDSSTWGLNSADMGNLQLHGTPTRNNGYTLWGDGSGNDANDSSTTDGSGNGTDVDSSYQIPSGSSVKQSPAMQSAGTIAFYDASDDHTYIVSNNLSPNLYAMLQKQAETN